MKCLMCNFDNPATVQYCKKCGKKLNLTREEIQAALKQKAALESARNVEYQTRQLLVVAVAFFAVTLTLWIAAGSLAPDEDHLVFVPAVSLGDKSAYAEVPYEFQPPLVAELLPLGEPAPPPPPPEK